MISVVNEVPEALYKAVQAFLDSHQEWDNNGVMEAALTMFILSQSKEEAP